MKIMRSFFMRSFSALVLCLFAALPALLGQESQDNQPHIQPQRPEVAPSKPKADRVKQPQSQPQPSHSQMSSNRLPFPAQLGQLPIALPPATVPAGIRRSISAEVRARGFPFPPMKTTTMAASVLMIRTGR
jgi:hypothetical protein